MSKEFIVKQTILYEARIKADSDNDAWILFDRDCTDTIIEWLDVEIEEVK